MNEFGFSPQPETCDHQGLWEVTTAAGYGVRYCAGCGASWFLWQRADDGTLAWLPMPALSAAEAEALAREEGEARGEQEQGVGVGA